ncbi:AraC family transcriptional regulator [Streptomyces sp. NPDC001515]
MFRTADMRAARGLETWRRLIGESRACDVSAERADAFRASVRSLRMGRVTLLRSSFSGVRIANGPAMARPQDPGMYHLTLILKGGLALTRGSEPTQTFLPGDLHVLDDSVSVELGTYGARSVPAHERSVEAIGLDLPMSLLPWSPEQLREVQGRGFSAEDGTGAILGDFLLSVDRRAASLGPAEAARLSTAAVGLVAAWLAPRVEAADEPPQEARLRELMESIRAFIERNLHDPRLTPAVVAEAHHISLSYLHRVFGRRSNGETVAAWIRAQRLERARLDLEDPALRSLPVHAVAARWGIPRPSDFSRAFRAAHGVSPQEHRMRRLNGADAPQERSGAA